MRYSPQREVVSDILRSCCDHPTADVIFHRAREKIPNISLATVYRNLSELTKARQVDTLETTDGFIHYDGNLTPHRHFICSECNRIVDLFIECPIPDELEAMGLQVETGKFLYYGKCDSCNH